MLMLTRSMLHSWQAVRRYGAAVQRQGDVVISAHAAHIRGKAVRIAWHQRRWTVAPSPRLPPPCDSPPAAPPAGSAPTTLTMKATKHIATMPHRRCQPRGRRLLVLPAAGPAAPPALLPLPSALNSAPSKLGLRAASAPCPPAATPPWARTGVNRWCRTVATAVPALLLLLLLLLPLVCKWHKRGRSSVSGAWINTLCA